MLKELALMVEQETLESPATTTKQEAPRTPVSNFTG